MKFRGEFGFLSNFAFMKVEVDGVQYPSVENAFQAMKCVNIADRKQFVSISPAEAKRLGRKVSMRADWNDVRVQVMKDLLVKKFQDAEMRKKLLAVTGEIVEENDWNDTFWGVCRGRGMNMLGKLLMEIREELKTEKGKVVAGTGHRPNRLGGYGDQVLVKLYRLALAELKRVGATKVISGGALGWDTAMALAAIKLEIPLVMAIPFKGQESKWPKESQERYRKILEKATEVVYVSDEGYEARKMFVRDQWMVDHCDLVLALMVDQNSGTGKTLEYAYRTNKPFINLWSKWEELK